VAKSLGHFIAIGVTFPFVRDVRARRGGPIRAGNTRPGAIVGPCILGQQPCHDGYNPASYVGEDQPTFPGPPAFTMHPNASRRFIGRPAFPGGSRPLAELVKVTDRTTRRADLRPHAGTQPRVAAGAGLGLRGRKAHTF